MRKAKGSAVPAMIFLMFILPVMVFASTAYLSSTDITRMSTSQMQSTLVQNSIKDYTFLQTKNYLIGKTKLNLDIDLVKTDLEAFLLSNALETKFVSELNITALTIDKTIVELAYIDADTYELTLGYDTVLTVGKIRNHRYTETLVLRIDISVIDGKTISSVTEI